jgi:hypothetical protein
VRTIIDTLRKRCKMFKKKTSQSSTGIFEAISWPHYDVADRLWTITPKISGIPSDMDVGQSSKLVVVGSIARPFTVDVSQTSIQVPDLNVGMEFKELEEA